MLDLNLLRALDALLVEGHVTRAAARVGITVPAMSRALARLRGQLGDPLLVRAGRVLVPTPRAVELRDRAAHALALASDVLEPRQDVAPLERRRRLVVRASDAVVAAVAATLAQRAAEEAPGVSLVFVEEGAEDVESLREGRVDLDVGVIDFAAPEIKSRALGEDRFVGVVRRGHPLLRNALRAESWAAVPQLAVSRAGRAHGPIDVALARSGLVRRVVATVPNFLAALHAVAGSDLATAVPRLLAERVERELALKSFPLPVPTPPITLGMAWHPRHDVDPAHRWLRAVFAQLSHFRASR